jgi:hypothetical protein
MKLENLKKLKPVKKPSKLRRWISGINAKLAGRYVNDIHPGFMTYLEKNNFLTASIWRDACVKKYKKIWKILDSDKYRKFFYKAINYNPAVKEKPIIDTRWHVVTYNKITYFLSKAYVFLFERGLYRKIKFFEKVSSEYADLSTRIDKYIASTTFEERLSRMHATGVLSDKSFQDDFDILMRRIPNDVVEERRNNAGYADGPQTFGSQWTMRRKLPDDISKLLHKA